MKIAVVLLSLATAVLSLLLFKQGQAVSSSAVPSELSAWELASLADHQVKSAKREKNASLSIGDYEKISLYLTTKIFPFIDESPISINYLEDKSDDYEIIIRTWIHHPLSGCGLDFSFRRDVQEYRGFTVIPGE